VIVLVVSALKSVLLVGLAVAVPACTSSAGREGRVTPVYNKETGRLEQVTADTSGDGRVDLRAHMEEGRATSVEIDRNGDGRPDRWEYYGPPASSGDWRQTLVRAEEANGKPGAVTRWEYYEKGVIDRVEEDTDADGRLDKWERYEGGALVRMDLDLAGRGYATRRFLYRPDGGVESADITAPDDEAAATAPR
jgi:hypothetical protein